MILWILFFISLAFGYEDPTQGKPFGPWLMNEQVKPMVKEAGREDNLLLLGGMIGGTYAAMPYDRKVREFVLNDGNLLMGHTEAVAISDLTHGWVQIGTSLTLIAFDTPEGMKLSRALIFSLASYTALKNVTRRERPDQSDHQSWPSGHTSSMFALAGSLAYSYGWKGAVPGYTAATLTLLSRLKVNDHWFSDVVAGAFLGTYWARVSQGVDENKTAMIIPVPVDDGLMITWQKKF